MSDLVFIAFDSEAKVEEVRDKVLAMQRQSLINVDDAVVLTHMTTDKVLADQKGVGGTVIRTSFDHAKEEELWAAALAGHVPAVSPAT